MTRLSYLAATAASLAVSTLPALAQQADLAAKLNEEGKTLMYAQKYAEASAKFSEAVARVPEPKYFFNLCTSKFQEGKFGEALTACNAVEKNNPTPELQTKATKLIGKIQDEAKNQGVNLQPEGGGGGDPNTMPPDPNLPPPDPNNPNANPNPNVGPPVSNGAVGRPPSQGLFTGTTADNNYTWTLGADFFGGGGRLGRDNFYGSASAGLRLKGDYLINPAARFGAQAYFQFSHFGQGEMQTADVLTLDVMDIGIAAYKHVCLTGTQRLCITPLAGVQIAMMSPAGESVDEYQVFNYTALGARLELGAQYAFGSRYEHVLGVAVGTNVYSRVVSESMDAVFSAETLGLDKGGAAGYVSLGYTYRFNTPLGSSPFVTLE
ncbi:MAG: hypothetical protein SFX73_10115 [Kofleriaceae bacterium]|nr:hypothetical protein [Kofleriaceae bacterium]